MKWKHMGVAALTASALSLAFAPAHAEDEQTQARKQMEQARKELERARAELQRATRELARSMAQVDRHNPRVQQFEYMTNPDRAVLGVLISDDVEPREDRGVRLMAVTPGGGAEKAGLEAGDLLLALDGTSLARDAKESPQQRMRAVMRRLKVGDEVKAEYERDGRRETVAVRTHAPEPDLALSLPMFEHWVEHEDFVKHMPMPGPMYGFRGAAIRGLELAKLDEDLGRYFQTTEGVLVVKAPKSGALALRSGDVIQKIDGKAVYEPVTVLDLLRSRDAAQTVKLEILRQGRKAEIEGKIPVADARDHMRKEERRRQKRVLANPHARAVDDDGT